MKTITVWQLLNKKSGLFEHNHIEDGHANVDEPVPHHPSQTGWKNGTWRKFHAHLDDDKVVYE